MQELKQIGAIIFIIPVLFGSYVSAADKNLSIQPDKVQRLMQRSKLLEGQIHVRLKNAQQRNDPTAKQYNIGYSDGYNKAVLDLLKSQLLGGVTGSAKRSPVQARNAETQRASTQPVSNSLMSAPVVVERDRTFSPRSVSPRKESARRQSSPRLSINTPPTIPATVVIPAARTLPAAFASAPKARRPVARKVPMAAKPGRMAVAKKVKPTIAAAVKPKKNYTDLLILSTKSLEAKNWSQAVSYASAALSLKPGSGVALINRSWGYAEQGLLHKALIDANESIRILPNNALAYNNRAYTYDLLSDISRARQDYQKACNLNFRNACEVVVKIDQLTKNRPQKIATLMAQSQTKIHQKSWRGLEELSNKIIMLDNSNTEALVHRSWAYAEQGRLDKALTDADRAILLSPNNALAYNNRAYTYELRNQLPKAEIDYQKSCKLNYQPACIVVQKIQQLNAEKAKKSKPKQLTGIQRLINQSLIMFRQGNWHAVEQLSNKILSLDPKNALAYVNRAGARTEMGLMYNALDDIKIALKLDPNLGIAHNNKAYALERMGKMPRAAKSYQRACDLGIQQSCQDYRRISLRISSSQN